MAIPKGNGPVAETKTTGAVVDPEMEAKLVDAIRVTKEELATIDEKSKKLEGEKLTSLWKAGERIESFCGGDLSSKFGHTIMARFSQETGRGESTIKLCHQIKRMLTPEQFRQAVDKKLTVRVIKSVVDIKDDKLRQKMLERALTEGLNDEDIRVITGRRGAKGGKKKKSSDRAKPPLRVFIKSSGVVTKTIEELASCTDAVNRLDEYKDEEAKAEAVQQLVEVRKAAQSAVETIEQFLKFTKPWEKTAIPKK